MPRSGTTLACAILGQCTNSVALSEPMDVGALPANDRTAALEMVQAFFDASRAELLAHGTATSKHRDGRIPENTFTGDPGARHSIDMAHGKITVEPRPQPGFTLAVKHNAAFAALLPELATRVRTIALVRHPLAVICSWHSIDIFASDGHIPAAERLDAQLRLRLASEPDRVERQLVVLDWFFGQFLSWLPADAILRYEDIVASQGDLLRRSAGVDGSQAAPLREKNANPDYARVDIPILAERLAARPGSWQALYPVATIAPLARRMCSVIDPG
ncbi:MAG: hypothetical protein ABIQ62_05275 [Thermomonas sp.]